MGTGSTRSTAKTPNATVEVLPEPGEERVARTGAVSSVQEAELSMSARMLTELWRPETLEGLARSYWGYLRVASRGLFKVVYAEDARTVVLAASWLPLLRFRAPQYERSAGSGSVTWRIDRGPLVAAKGRGKGWLRIEVRRDDVKRAIALPGRGDVERVRVRVEVRNFYPWLRGSGAFARFGAWLYSQTQLRIHRRITIGFLRSLASFEPSPVSKPARLRGTGS